MAMTEEEKKALQDEMDAKLQEKLSEERTKWEAEYEKKSEEKSKTLLKETMTTVKQQLRDDIDAAKKEALEKSKELEEAKKKIEELDKSRTTDPNELAALKKLADEKEELLKVADERTKALLDNLSNEFKSTLAKKDVELYIQKKIAEGDGEIIPDLVRGSTVEEVDQAYETAKQRFAELISNAEKKKEQKRLDDGKLPIPTSSGQNINTTEKTAEEIARMSKNDFEEYSREVLKKYL